MRTQGRITGWKDEQGYGFIKPDEGGEKIFFHITSFVKSRDRRPVDGEKVSFELGTDSEGRPQSLKILYNGQRLPKTRRKRFSLPPFRLFIVVVFCLMLIVAVGNEELHVAVIYLYLIMSCVSFLAYAFDKTAALRGQWRTRENTLHFLDLLCGWPGGLIAQTVFTHKTRKPSFLLTTWCMILLNCAVLLGAEPLLHSGLTLPAYPEQLRFDHDKIFRNETPNADDDPNFGIKITPQ